MYLLLNCTIQTELHHSHCRQKLKCSYSMKGQVLLVFRPAASLFLKQARHMHEATLAGCLWIYDTINSLDTEPSSKREVGSHLLFLNPFLLHRGNPREGRSGNGVNHYCSGMHKPTHHCP